MEKLALNLREAAVITSTSLTTVKGAIRSGDLPSLKIGRARRVLRADLVLWLRDHREARKAAQ